MVPKRKTKQKTFNKKELNSNLHAEQKPKGNKHFFFKFRDTYTHMPKRAYDHKFTKTLILTYKYYKTQIKY